MYDVFVFFVMYYIFYISNDRLFITENFDKFCLDFIYIFKNFFKSDCLVIFIQVIIYLVLIVDWIIIFCF